MLISNQNNKRGLDAIMRSKGVTSQMLSYMTEIPKQTIDAYRAKRRNMNLENGCKIAKALEVHPERLLELEAEEC